MNSKQKDFTNFETPNSNSEKLMPIVVFGSKVMLK